MESYTVRSLGQKWIVVDPQGSTEAVVEGADAERRARAICDEKNAELWEQAHPTIRRETDRLHHGGLLVISERRPDGTMVLRIDPGNERIEIHMHSQGGVIQ